MYTCSLVSVYRNVNVKPKKSRTCFTSPVWLTGNHFNMAALLGVNGGHKQFPTPKIVHIAYQLGLYSLSWVAITTGGVNENEIILP